MTKVVNAPRRHDNFKCLHRSSKDMKYKLKKLKYKVNISTVTQGDFHILLFMINSLIQKRNKIFKRAE